MQRMCYVAGVLAIKPARTLTVPRMAMLILPSVTLHVD